MLCILRSVLLLTPKFTNEPKSISDCWKVAPDDVTLALMKNESLFAMPDRGVGWLMIIFVEKK